jgi:ribosomal protein S6--L-glutamate ligase
MLNIKEIDVMFGSDDEKTQIVYKGESLPNYDCVYVKGSFNYASISRAITAFFEGKAYMPVGKEAFTIVHDKLLTHIQFQKSKIPSPLTYLSSTSLAAKKILKKIPYPIILKFPQGTHGKGVMVADSYAAASSILDALDSLNQSFLIQEYIETNGVDIRAFVVGNKVIAAMKRKAHKDEKRSNIHAGGVAESHTINARTEKLAIDTAKCLELGIAGVDILEGPKGPLVIEANVSPGLQGISAATGINIADEIAKFLFEQTQKFMHQKSSESPTADQILAEISIKPATEEVAPQQIFTNLDYRGDRLLLPAVISRIANFTEQEEVIIEVKRKSIIITK